MKRFEVVMEMVSHWYVWIVITLKISNPKLMPESNYIHLYDSWSILIGKTARTKNNFYQQIKIYQGQFVCVLHL